MYADAGETDNECILSGSDASVPLFSVSTEGTIFSRGNGMPGGDTQLTEDTRARMRIGA